MSPLRQLKGATLDSLSCNVEQRRHAKIRYLPFGRVFKATNFLRDVKLGLSDHVPKSLEQRLGIVRAR